MAGDPKTLNIRDCIQMTRRALAAPVRPKDGDFGPVVASFHRSLRAENRSPLTIKAYGKATTQLLTFLLAKDMPSDVARIERQHVEEFIEHLQARGLAEATVAQRWRSLSVFFSWLLAEEHIAASPMERMRIPRVTVKPVPVLPAADVQALLASAPGRNATDVRDRAIIQCFYCTGLRLSELANIRLDDINLDTRSARILGKGGRYRVVKFSHEAVKALDRYLIIRDQSTFAADEHLWLGGKGRLTPWGIAQMLRRRATVAGIKLHAHMFRHTFAATWLANGGQEQDLLELAGWNSPVMLQRYGRATRAARAQSHYDEFAPRLRGAK
jgi:site-specific recombinase XerD